jgi:hypothetical protein
VIAVAEIVVGCSVQDEEKVAKELYRLTHGVHWEPNAGWEVHAGSCAVPKYTALMRAIARSAFPPMSEVDAQRLATDVWERAREAMPGVEITVSIEASDGAWVSRS